jgi:phosphoenolpyruvate carboxylase
MSITLLILGGRILQSLLISMASQAGRMVEMELLLKE